MDVSNLPIEVLGLTTRSQNALYRAGLRMVNQLLGCTEEELYAIPNLGKKSVDDILEKVQSFQRMGNDEIQRLQETNIGFSDAVDVTERDLSFAVWIQDEKNQQLVVDYLKTENIKISQVESLSAREYNLLSFAGYHTLDQIAFLSQEQLQEIHRMDPLSACEIVEKTNSFLEQIQNNIFSYARKKKQNEGKSQFRTILDSPEHQKALRSYIRINNVPVDTMDLPRKCCKKLKENGYNTLLDFVFVSLPELREQLNIDRATADKINQIIENYGQLHASRIHSLCEGNIDILWDDDNLQKRILAIYNRIGFAGLSLQELEDKLQAPVSITPDRIKKILGKLIESGTLEYVDFRCFRIYPKFEDYILSCHNIEPRDKEIIQKRLHGATLDEIGQEYNITRERVRQIIKAQTQKIRAIYTAHTGLQYFDEDYYRYLYTTYALDRNDSIKWLGISQADWRYLEAMDLEPGKKDLNEALEDKKGLEIGLRLKIKNYLNRNKLFIDETWIDRKRSNLEEVVVRKFCQNSTSFDHFMQIYNQFLKEEEIPYDEKLYYTEDVCRARKNHLANARFLLWTQNETIRYYDIDSRDYTELLDGLNLDSFENIELSTEKFIADYPELMQRYDIRDRYELHNLLKKVIKDGDYHNFHSCRMPNIRFGDFNRDTAVFEIMVEMSPVSLQDLAAEVSRVYGYDIATVEGTYLQPLSLYYHQGIYSINQKPMSLEHREQLKQMLKEDFYYLDEIRIIYQNLIPDADLEEINPMNLKAMGFIVLSRYAVQHYPSLEDYCEHLLTCEDITDIRSYKKKFASVTMFSQKLMELKRSLTVIEYAPDHLIHIRKLKQSGITREMIHAFCDQVCNKIEDNTYFSARSLRLSSFQSPLYDLGFDDWFYANLLIADERFSFSRMFGTIILYKGKKDVTIKSCLNALIQKHRSVDILDLMDELENAYGCNPMDKTDLIYKTQGTEVYYDRYLERFYANQDLYYRELDEAEEV